MCGPSTSPTPSTTTSRPSPDMPIGAPIPNASAPRDIRKGLALRVCKIRPRWRDRCTGRMVSPSSRAGRLVSPAMAIKISPDRKNLTGIMRLAGEGEPVACLSDPVSRSGTNELLPQGMTSSVLKKVGNGGCETWQCPHPDSQGSFGARRASDMERGTGANGSVRAVAFGRDDIPVSPAMARRVAGPRTPGGGAHDRPRVARRRLGIALPVIR